MLDGERGRVCDHGVVTAKLDLGLQPILERGQPELVQPGDLFLQERLEREVGKRRPAPERERVAQRGGSLRRRKRPRVADEPLEAARVDRAGSTRRT